MPEEMSDPRFVRSDDCLLDTSWTLYRIAKMKWTVHYILDEDAFAPSARDLDALLRKTAPGGDEYDYEDSDKDGGYHDVSYKVIRQTDDSEPMTHTSKQSRIGLLVSIKYDNSTYKAIFLRDRRRHPSQQRPYPNFPVVMLRMPPTLTRRFLSFLETNPHISASGISPFKLSTSQLSGIFSTYMLLISSVRPEVIVLPAPPPTFDQDLPSQIIRDLRITLSFSAPVSPGLRSLDIDIPFETVWKFLTLPDSNFFEELGDHISRTTGLHVPWAKSPDPPLSAAANWDDETIRISRISCSSLAISADGKLKYVSKYAAKIEDEEMKEKIKEANENLLMRLVSTSTSLTTKELEKA